MTEHQNPINPNPNPASTSWWQARTGLEKVVIALGAVVAGLGIGAGVGVGVATAVEQFNGDQSAADPIVEVEDVDTDPVDQLPELPAVPEEPVTVVKTVVVPTPTTVAPPATTTPPPPPTTTVDPRPARRAEIADEIRVIDAEIDGRRNEIRNHRIAEVEACDARAAEAHAAYESAKQRTAKAVGRVNQAVANVSKAQSDLVLAMAQPIFFPGAAEKQAKAIKALAEAEQEVNNAKAALETAKADEEQARKAGIAATQACEDLRNSYGPIDSDPHIQDLMHRRQALVDEYNSLG